jgi:hypothetical protein
VHAGLVLRMASLRCGQERLADGSALFEQAIAAMKGLCEASPRTDHYWNSLRWFHQEYAERLRAGGRAESAERVIQEFEQWMERMTSKMSEPEERRQMELTEEWIVDLRRAAEP